MMISKKEIRSEVLTKRAILLPDEKKRWDEAILYKIRHFFQKPGRAVYAYVSIRGEAGTELIIDELLKIGCRVALPRVSGRQMSFFYIDDMTQLSKGAYGIPEPVDGCIKADDPSAPVITPGVGFSPDGSRVGYGAGYYDRFFAAEPEHQAIGICYDFQVFSDIETDTYDKKMSYVITPTRSFKSDKVHSLTDLKA